MKHCLVASLALLVFVAWIPAESHAEEKAAAMPHIEMLDDVTIKKLTTSGALSEQHQLLLPLAGTWYYELKYWTKEGAEPQVSTGTAKNEMILNGRYLLSKTSLILNIGGQSIPYESWEMLGYDKSKKAFTSVRTDSMHDGLVTGSGLYDEKLNKIEEKGNFKNPLDEKTRSYRSVLEWIDDETYKRTFFITGESGNEYQVIEIIYERR